GFSLIVSAVSRFVPVRNPAVIDAHDVGMCLCVLGSEGSTIGGSTLEKDRAGATRNFRGSVAPVGARSKAMVRSKGRGSFFTKVRRDPLQTCACGRKRN